MSTAATPTPPLHPGDIILTHSPSALGRAIRLGQRIRYDGWTYLNRCLLAMVLHRPKPVSPANAWTWANHAAVVVSADHCVEALAHGLTLSPLSKYPPGSFTVAYLDPSEDEREAAVKFALDMLGRHARYSWLGIASIALQLLTPSRLDVSIDGSMICSAFAARVWEHAGIDLPTWSPYTTMPADVASFARALPPGDALAGAPAPTVRQRLTSHLLPLLVRWRALNTKVQAVLSHVTVVTMPVGAGLSVASRWFPTLQLSAGKVAATTGAITALAGVARAIASVLRNVPPPPAAPS